MMRQSAKVDQLALKAFYQVALRVAIGGDPGGDVHVKKMATFHRGGRGRGHLHVKNMGHLQFSCAPPYHKVVPPNNH